MSLLLDVGASVRTAADELPIAGVVAAADRLRAAIDLLTWVRTASIRPLGVPQLAGALEHSEHAAYALLVARDELATYLKAIGLPGDAPPATPPPQRAPTPAAPPATGAATGSGLPPLLRWWCERVDALTGCAGDYDESDAAPDSTELLRRVANAGDRTKLRAELVRSSPPIGLGLAALAPVGLRNLATELLGHPPGPQDLRRLQGAVVATETPARAAAERAARLAEVEGRHADTLADLTDRAAEAAEKEAPAAAGAAWESWHMSTRDRSATPKLLRIGEVRVGEHPPVPALVPLLDRAHVALTGEPAAQVDQVLTTLLLRALGATPPGSVRLTGYDPERLGGGLAGFAPLAAGGLLRFVGPGGLGALLDTLVEEIRRINETVLAGDYPSLGPLAAANDGRRPEPWRVAVLLGDGGDLSRHERAQLDRIV